MAEFPAMPLWTDAYLGDTTHLTTTEHGAYFLLLMTLWRSKEPVLPDDDKLLARYTRLTSGQWKRVRPILEPFFTITPDGWMQGRLTDEWLAVRLHSTKQSDRAKGRWLKNKKTGNATALPERCRNDASPSLTLPFIEEDNTSVLPSSPIPPKGDVVNLYSPEFEKMWMEYPRNGASKKMAAESYAKAIKGGTDHEAIFRGVEQYRKYCQRSGTKIAHATTWLNQGRWTVDYANLEYEPRSISSGGPSVDEQAAAIKQAIRDGKL